MKTFDELLLKYSLLSKETLIELLALRDYEEQEEKELSEEYMPKPIHVPPITQQKPIDWPDFTITCSSDNTSTTAYKRHKNPLTK